MSRDPANDPRIIRGTDEDRERSQTVWDRIADETDSIGDAPWNVIPPPLDWRDMFHRYLEAVGAAEGVSFLNHVDWCEAEAEAIRELSGEPWIKAHRRGPD